jgi:hypothetical protein
MSATRHGSDFHHNYATVLYRPSSGMIIAATEKKFGF